MQSDVFLKELKALKCRIDAEPAQALRHKGKFLLKFHPSSVAYARASDADRHIMAAYTTAADAYLTGEATLEQIAATLPQSSPLRRPMARKERHDAPMYPDLYFAGQLDQVQRTLCELSEYKEVCLKQGNVSAAEIIAMAIKQGESVLGNPASSKKAFYDMRDELCRVWYICCTHISSYPYPH